MILQFSACRKEIGTRLILNKYVIGDDILYWLRPRLSSNTSYIPSSCMKEDKSVNPNGHQFTHLSMRDSKNLFHEGLLSE